MGTKADAAIQEEAPFVYNKYGQANILDLGHRVCKWTLKVWATSTS